LKHPETIEAKILSLKELVKKSQQWKAAGKKIAFTNGCFDILHAGHIYSLSQAAKEADYLIVGLNADASVKKLKGENRPVNDEQSRAQVLAALQMVDAVVIFAEETPLDLIKNLLPDVLVKGGDYTINEIAGAKEVIAAGGKIVLNPLLEGFSTSALIKKAAGG
jgi:D-beta-D-heptose 7-phosphate kinase/D-beta-D-heptose 1-phosphate adenosyltransferase